MKLQSIVDDASDLLMTSKYEADQANRSIDYYTELEVVEGKIPGIQVTVYEGLSWVIGPATEYK
jgi:hypothetical protein